MKSRIQSLLSLAVCGSAVLAQGSMALAQPAIQQQTLPQLQQQQAFPAVQVQPEAIDPRLDPRLNPRGIDPRYTPVGPPAQAPFPVTGMDPRLERMSGSCLNAPVKTPYYWPANPRMRFARNYSSVLEWCETAITNLKRAQDEARWAYYNESADTAVNILYSALMREAQAGGFTTPAPNTADAVRVSANIAIEAFAAANDPELQPRTRTDLKMRLLDSLYQIIIWAYDNLDRPYYADVYNACQGGNCYTENTGSILPDQYEDALRQIAEQFVNMQSVLAPAQASNYAELRIAHSVVIGARDILLASTLNREFCHPISVLIQTEEEISKYLYCSGNMPTRSNVMRIRGLIHRASFAMEICRLAQMSCAFVV